MGGRTNIHDEERSGRPSIVSDELVQCVDQKFVRDGASQFQKFRVDYHSYARLPQVLCKMVSEKYSQVAQNAENGFSFCRLFRAIPQR
jgi:hypothetical protein